MAFTEVIQACQVVVCVYVQGGWGLALLGSVRVGAVWRQTFDMLPRIAVVNTNTRGKTLFGICPFF